MCKLLATLRSRVLPWLTFSNVYTMGRLLWWWLVHSLLAKKNRDLSSLLLCGNIACAWMAVKPIHTVKILLLCGCGSGREWGGGIARQEAVAWSVFKQPVFVCDFADSAVLVGGCPRIYQARPCSVILGASSEVSWLNPQYSTWRRPSERLYSISSAHHGSICFPPVLLRSKTITRISSMYTIDTLL